MRGIAVVVMCMFLAGGCSWLGNTAGKAQAKIERKIDAVEKGYEEGYNNEPKTAK